MKEVTITVSAGREKDAPTVEVTKVLPESLDEAVSEYGEEVVFSIVLSKVKVLVQDVARKALKEGKAADEIQALVDNFKPGVITRRKKSLVDKIKDNWANLSPEEKKELLEMLKAK